MGHRKNKHSKKFGKDLKHTFNRRNIKKGLIVGGKSAGAVGRGLTLLGTVTGQPELVAAGGGVSLAGSTSRDLGKSELLKKHGHERAEHYVDAAIPVVNAARQLR